MVLENQLQQKQKEIQSVKQKLELKISKDQKSLIRNRLDFERHFGREPRQNEEKYVNFLKLYEEQREKMEFTVRGLEKENDRLNKCLVELENENFALSKGKMPTE